MSLNYKPLYEDTVSIKVMPPLTAEQKSYIAKCFLNAQYGTMVTNYKENDMRIKDFIVLHADGQPLMIKKDSIETLSKMSDGTAKIETTNQIWVTDEKYVDVIKRLFE